MQTYRRGMGHTLLINPAGRNTEIDSVICGHCQAMVDVKPFQDPADAGAFCSSCARVVCNLCAKAAYRSGKCLPWEEELAEYEAKQAVLKNLRESLGLGV